MMAKCVVCTALVSELVPWASGNCCLGCYKNDATAAAALAQLTPAALARITQLAPELAVHREGRCVQLQQLAERFFQGRVAMAQGYVTACGQTPDPLQYSALMLPFYSLLDQEQDKAK